MIPRKYSDLIVTTLLVSTISLPAQAANEGFQELIILGNSVTDTGNLFNLTGGNFPPSDFYDRGRFSNGDIWIDDFSSDLGLNLNNFYGNNITEIGEGLNFSVGGATSGTTTLGDTDTVMFPGVTTQVDNFLSFLNATGSTIGEDTLIVLWIGENDYVEAANNYLENLDPENPPEPSEPSLFDVLEQTVGTSVGNIDNSLTRLADAGAKNVVVSNLVDLNNVPLARSLATSPEELAGLSQLSIGHNNALNGVVGSLNASFPEANIGVFDAYGTLNNVVNNSAAFGFNNTTELCLDNNFPNIDFEAQPCDNPDEYLYYDNQHYTSAAHSIIADSALDTINQQFPDRNLPSNPVASVPESRNAIALIALGFGFVTRLAIKKIKV